MVVVLPFCFFLYVIFASVAVASVFDRWKTLSGAVVCRDLDTFLQYRDERLPILMHILIGAPSILLAAFVMVLDYGETAWGAAAVFAVVYMLALVWSIAIELDDFHRAIWFQAKVPDHWYEVDVEAHFKLPAPQRIAEARRGS